MVVKLPQGTGVCEHIGLFTAPPVSFPHLRSQPRYPLMVVVFVVAGGIFVLDGGFLLLVILVLLVLVLLQVLVLLTLVLLC